MHELAIATKFGSANWSPKNFKVAKLFYDKTSGATTKRPELQKMLDYIRDDDVVIVTELDRLGCNNHDLTKIMGAIKATEATLIF